MVFVFHNIYIMDNLTKAQKRRTTEANNMETQQDTDERTTRQCPNCKGTGKTAQEESDDAREDRCEEMLNDIYGEVEVCNYKYDAGRCLKELDPIAFRCATSEMDDLEETDCEECDGSGEVDDNSTATTESVTK